jgi:hypothetical protein
MQVFCQSSVISTYTTERLNVKNAVVKSYSHGILLAMFAKGKQDVASVRFQMPFDAPILLITFNRLRVTQKVFAAIRDVKPSKLYIASDGARSHCVGEAQKVDEVRQFLLSAVDWPCDVHTLFRSSNAGCKMGVSGAIDWFFKTEESGIILEDDCLPHPDFFKFCAEMLNRHKNDSRVLAINGCNFQNDQKRGQGDYYFSRFMHVWGWATWRRAWDQNDVDLKFWPTWKQSQTWLSFFGRDAIQRRFWDRVFDRMYAQKIDTWDHAWVASLWHANGFVITPNVNMVSNIGFGADATHTFNQDSMMADRPVFAMATMTAPASMGIDRAADRYTFDHSFGGRNKRWPRRVLFLHKDVKRWIKSYLK